ncbi:MAG: hypothetical protein AAGF87_07125 [Bacteroidota bacterium]
MKYLSFLLLMCFASVHAQDTVADDATSIDAQILSAYVDNDPQQWDAVIDHLKQHATDTETQLKLGHVAYTAVGTAFGKRDMDMAAKYLEVAEEALENVLDADDKHPSAHGLMSGIAGMGIALDESKAMTLGMASNRHARKALQYGEEDPVALAMAASQQIYTPRQWGGDPDRGLELIGQSVALFEAMDSPESDWRYYESLILMGEAYTKVEQREAARAVYLKVLSMQPELAYVKYYLLPSLDQ